MKNSMFLIILSASFAAASMIDNNCDDCGPKKGVHASTIHHQSMNKLQKYLNVRQHELIKQNPGSLLAVARALKMTIVECRYQMRHEPWDCPIYGFSIKPTDIFGKLMSRSFKETSFIHSLLSSAIAHSIARACTESMISTCSRPLTRDKGYSENIEFGHQFAQKFMEATHELSASSLSSSSAPLSTTITSNNIDVNLNNNIIGTGNDGEPTTFIQHNSANNYNLAANVAGSLMEAPLKKDKTSIRRVINRHNDAVGRLFVLEGMRRECKCHGLSGACNIKTCWLKLPPFREVASKLHDSLDQAVKVIYVQNLQKSLTSPATVKKTNKKRSSIPQQAPVNGLTRSSTLLSSSLNQQYPQKSLQTYSSPEVAAAAAASYESNSLTRDTASIVGSRKRATNNKRHTSTDNCEHQDCYRAPVAASTSDSNDTNDNGSAGGTFTGNISSYRGANTGIGHGTIQQQAKLLNLDANDHHSIKDNQIQQSSAPSSTLFSPSQILTSSSTSTNSSTVLKRRPVARSIGVSAYITTPSKFDLVYYEESPDFCEPSERYNIKGTKGRVCSESQNASNNCERLCCGRGYKTEVRLEKYKCECQFKFCCKLDCNTCTRRKVVHKCL